MAILIYRGKKQVISDISNDLKIEFEKLEITNKLDFKCYENILFMTKNTKVILTLGIESEIFNDTKIMQTIYSFERWDIKFVNFGNIMNLIGGFISMYEFLKDDSNNKKYKFINKASQHKHLNIKPHIDNLFAFTPNLPITKTKVSQYRNFLYYHYKSIHGYFLQEKLLQNVYKNLKFDINLLDVSQYLNKFTNNSDTKKLFEEIALLLSCDYENVLKNSAIQLKDNDSFRVELDSMVIKES